MTDWLDYAYRKIMSVRQLVRAECWPHHHWPIWITGRDVRFPGDDFGVPRRRADNDNVFSFGPVA